MYSSSEEYRKRFAQNSRWSIPIRMFKIPFHCHVFITKMAVLITRKYVNNSNEILNKRTYKQTRFQERSRIKDVVERCA